jgi:hypothetical protein
VLLCFPFEPDTNHAYAPKCMLVRSPASLLIMLWVFPQTDLTHPSLYSREFTSLKGPNGEKVFEAYAQQETSAAYRIFWYYGPDRKQITIVVITPHP